MLVFNANDKKLEYKKVLLSIAAGIISYFINSLPIHIQLTSVYQINLLAGLILPLAISIAWGWRYGLLAALFGPVQSLWFADINQGYGLLYTVFMYMAWVGWHGFFSSLRVKNASQQKWYHNIFSVELAFRLVFETGFLVAFPALLALNPAAWQLNPSAVTWSPDQLFFLVTSRLILGYALMFVLRLFNRYVHQPALGMANIGTPGKNIVHLSLLFAFVVIFIQAVGATYFSNIHFGTVMENLLNFSTTQIFMRGLIIASFFIFGFALQYYFNKSEKAVKSLKESNIALKRHEEDINHVLQLASDIGKAEKIDPVNFLANLLRAAINIIPEADYGFTFREQHGGKFILSQTGHDPALIGARIEMTRDPRAKDEVILANNIKARLLTRAVGSDYFNLRENMRNASESLMILSEHDDEIIAGMVLGIDPSKNKHFSEQSLKISGFLKDISVAFYNYLHLAEEREDTYKDIIMSSLRILSLHNAYTKDHSTGVANLSREIALCMSFSYKEAETIYWAGLVHDIGKILISDDILDKGSKLTHEEFEIIKRHSTLGYETFRESPNLTNISKYIYHHHEKWDGSGYPFGLSESNIPLPSRILSVADVFDALTHDRPYRKAISKDEALDYIRENAGIQFDPEICDIFFKNFDSIYEKYNAS